MLLLLFGVLFPLGLLTPPDHAGLRRCWATRSSGSCCSGCACSSLLHWAHRFRYTLYDGLQLKRWSVLISALCYGGAIAGSVWAAFVLLG